MGMGLGWALLFTSAFTAQAAKIGDLTQTRWTEQAWRFVTLSDPVVRYACLGTLLLGISCGLLGSFLVVRRMALLGDALSHAVLPGVALGFLWNLEKDPLAIFIGALLAGLAGSATVSILTRTTRLKEDTALGMVLASFFGLGLCLMSMFQRLPTGNKSGIETFLFGQAAALGPGDIQVMGAVTLVVVGLLGLGYKEFLLVSFDPGFARVLALPTVWFERLLVMLLAFAVVSALQAVGVVLVSAMLIIPAATASIPSSTRAAPASATRPSATLRPRLSAAATTVSTRPARPTISGRAASAATPRARPPAPPARTATPASALPFPSPRTPGSSSFARPVRLALSSRHRSSTSSARTAQMSVASRTSPVRSWRPAGRPTVAPSTSP
jgi:ABC-type Mn2+/Zn2+ transport system permease subunit